MGLFTQKDLIEAIEKAERRILKEKQKNIYHYLKDKINQTLHFG